MNSVRVCPWAGLNSGDSIGLSHTLLQVAEMHLTTDIC